MAKEEGGYPVYSVIPEKQPAPMTFKEVQKDIDISQFRGSGFAQVPFEGKLED